MWKVAPISFVAVLFSRCTGVQLGRATKLLQASFSRASRALLAAPFFSWSTGGAQLVDRQVCMLSSGLGKCQTNYRWKSLVNPHIILFACSNRSVALFCSRSICYTTTLFSAWSVYSNWLVMCCVPSICSVKYVTTQSICLLKKICCLGSCTPYVCWYNVAFIILYKSVCSDI